MDVAAILALILFFIHIAAFIAGGANSVIMPIIGPKIPGATPEVRAQLFDLIDRLAKVGKFAMGTLLVTGVLTLWLKWNWSPPSPVWFWIKMLGIVAMIVFIVQNERNSRAARAGDAAAGKRSQMFGMLTGLAFAVVLLSAVFAFN
jgi:protoporphyrinogen IX oxidase